MSDINKIARDMRDQWDRRIRHDYRFWMSDGHRSDQEMWGSGERDFAILSAGYNFPANAVSLELGCGVGRLLRAAKTRSSKVIGFDVSQVAIERAKELLVDVSGVEPMLCSGVDLQPVLDSSIDFAWSFAAITSMPVEVIARYLREFKRVLKPNGCLRLQVYLGEELLVSANDTLHLRCFKRENLARALQAAGFNLDSVTELILPFQVSFKEIGVEAFIISASPNGQRAEDPDTIAQILLPAGESEKTEDITSTDIEYWMAINYAEELINEGDFEKAKATVDYVVAHCRSTTIDVQDLLQRIEQKIKEHESKRNPQSGVWSSENFERNIRVLRERFPEIVKLIESCADATLSTNLRDTPDGPVIFWHGQCLDHAEKPISAARTWIERSLADRRYSEAKELVIFGFGCGYHLEDLLNRQSSLVSCIEPDLKAFATALGARDLVAVLSRLTHLSVGEGLSIEWASTETELLVRPQTTAIFAREIQSVKRTFYGKRGLGLLRPKMAVLGPLQGGTLPIGQYTNTALMRSGQRVRGIDLSGFNQGWQLLDDMVKFPTRKRAVHNAYIEMLSYALLESLTEKPVDILICMAQAPISPRVLAEIRKSGTVTVLWFVEDYLRFTYWRELAQYYDFVFTIQKGDCITAIKNAGAGEVHYLPTACDPYVHTPMTLSQEDKTQWGSPISFVGAGYHNRQQMFASLANLPFKIWGSEWPGCRPFDRMVQEQARRISPEEYVKIFNSTEINLNLHSSMERDGVDPFGDFLNPRTFELAACGAFQLVDERTLLPEAFEVGKEVITFKSGPDLKQKIEYYMGQPELRAEIANSSRARVLRDHTYDHRLEQMLQTIYASKFEQLRGRQESGLWNQMITQAKPYPELQQRCMKAAARGEEPNLDGLVSDIVTGNGKLSETEQKLLFLFHVRKQIVRMSKEEAGGR